MLYYLKKYPLSILTIIFIVYLSFFTPPKTEVEKIPYIDKLIHLAMYGGLCFFIWIEYLRSHQILNSLKIIIGGIILPIIMSGAIEWLQAHCTNNRSGDWIDFVANISGVFIAAFIGKKILLPFVWRKKV